MFIATFSSAMILLSGFIHSGRPCLLHLLLLLHTDTSVSKALTLWYWCPHQGTAGAPSTWIHTHADAWVWCRISQVCPWTVYVQIDGPSQVGGVGGWNLPQIISYTNPSPHLTYVFYIF